MSTCYHASPATLFKLSEAEKQDPWTSLQKCAVRSITRSFGIQLGRLRVSDRGGPSSVRRQATRTASKKYTRDECDVHEQSPRAHLVEMVRGYKRCSLCLQLSFFGIASSMFDFIECAAATVEPELGSFTTFLQPSGRSQHVPV